MQSVCPIVKPDTVRIPLSSDQFIEVKRELNAREHRKMFAGQYREGADKFIVDLERVGGFSRILAYVVNWSFVDFNGSALEFNEDTLGSIGQGWFKEILDAVDAHHAEIEKELESRKNGKAGTPPSEAILASVGS